MKQFFTAIFLVLCFANQGYAQNSETLSVSPFEYADVTSEQKDAWNQYISEQSMAYGCTYGDDSRLTDSPRELLKSLASGEQVPPVQITLRSFLSAGDAVQELLTRNVKIASVTCNNVYYYQGDLVGQPVLPFEEYLNLITDSFQAPEDIKTVAWIAKNAKIAPLDPRIMWPFFVMHEEYYSRLGLSYPKLEYIIKALDPTQDDITPITAPSLLFRVSMNLGNNVEGLPCQDPSLRQQPAGTLFIDPDLDMENIGAANANLGVATWIGDAINSIPPFHAMQGSFSQDENRPWLNTNRKFPIIPQDCTK